MRLGFFHGTVSLVLVLSAGACSSETPVTGATESGNDSYPSTSYRPSGQQSQLIKGADVSWLTDMEANGVKFYYSDGTEGDCLDILRGLGVNTFRFRLWVDPADGYCSISDVVEKSRRAEAAGASVMIDFHYSDSWADPSAQNVPAAWAGMGLDALVEKVGDYTRESLRRLKDEGIDVKYVQIGNETGNGMLWPYGQADINPVGYARLNNAGYEAVKDVFPQAKAIVHIQNGQDSSLARWILGLLRDNGGKFDIAGFSLYPGLADYQFMVTQARATMNWCVSELGCDVMLCEVGMGNSYEEECKDFLWRCFNLSEEIADSRFLGVLYWEPQVYNDWNGYRKGAFTSQGRPGPALESYGYSGAGVSEISPD